MNIVTIPGWIAVILFTLDFGTCLAMPWTKKEEELELKGCKGKGCHSAGITSYHKPFVILAIVAVIVHMLFWP